MLVELKNGETLNGHLVSCDTWMNLTLKEVVQTSPVRFPPLVVSCAHGLEMLDFRCAGANMCDGTGRRQVLSITGGLCQGQQRTFSIISVEE
jgi:small nuclear ribonucleoprotein (snRNP)-like protein